MRGRIIGLLGATGPLDRPTSHTLGLVMSMRATIVQPATSQLVSGSQSAPEQVNPIWGPSPGVIVWNQEDPPRQPTGSPDVRINPRTVVGQPLASGRGFYRRRLWRPSKDSELHDIIVQVNDHQDIRVVMTLRPSWRPAQPLSYVA